MPPEFAPLQAVLERATLMTTLGWLVIGFMKGWIAPGSAVKAKDAEIQKWVERHDRLAGIAESALRKISGA